MNRRATPLDRRGFLVGSTALAACTACRAEEEGDSRQDKLARQVGITTSSLSGHVAASPARGKITLLELPRVLREELDMRVIDLNTSTLASDEPKYLDRVREAADKAGCVLTNLKMNQRGLDMNSPDEKVRRHALEVYTQSINTAARLGCRWARPLPQQPKPDMRIHVASYRELAAVDRGDRPGRGRVARYRQLDQRRGSLCRAGPGVSSGGHVRFQGA
jgi:hypothetical protein